MQQTCDRGYRREMQRDRNAMVRCVDVPERNVGPHTVVARPGDGIPLVLGPTAALVWRLAVDWTTPEALDRSLAQQYPDVGVQERSETLDTILSILDNEGLLERST